MARRYRFRFKVPGGRGGLAADLVAEAVLPPAPVEHGMRVLRNVWLSVPDGAFWKDVAWLGFGVSLSAPALAEAHPAGLRVEVRELDYPFPDYRSEIAALAMDGWLREEFSVPPTGAEVGLESDGFTFRWGRSEPPFSDAA